MLALGTPSHRATERIAVNVPRIICQFSVNPQQTWAELERAARQIEAGAIPRDANAPAICLVQMLNFNVRKACTEMVISRAWSEAEIVELQRQRGNRHLPWLRNPRA